MHYFTIVAIIQTLYFPFIKVERSGFTLNINYLHNSIEFEFFSSLNSRQLCSMNFHNCVKGYKSSVNKCSETECIERAVLYKINAYHRKLDYCVSNSDKSENDHYSVNSFNTNDYIKPKCISISSTHVCAPYQNLYIDSNILSEIYGVDELDADSWQKLVIDKTSGIESQTTSWLGLECPNYNGEMIQYYRSFVCLTDIFKYSKKCNNEIIKTFPALCENVCDQYTESVSQLINNNYYCTPSKLPSILKRRENVMKSASECKTILKNFEISAGCISGVGLDVFSCGFAGKLELTAKYCKLNSIDPCCINEEKLKFSEMEPNPKSFVTLQNQSSSAIDLGMDLNGMNVIAIVSGSIGVILFVVLMCVCLGRKSKGHAGVKRAVHRKVGTFPLIGEPKAISSTNGELQNGDLLRVKWAYVGQVEDEIDMNVGDSIRFLGSQDEHWAEVCNLTTKMRGIIPTAYCERVSVD
jgi:hypothetical protein